MPLVQELLRSRRHSVCWQCIVGFTFPFFFLSVLLITTWGPFSFFMSAAYGSPVFRSYHRVHCVGDTLLAPFLPHYTVRERETLFLAMMGHFLTARSELEVMFSASWLPRLFLVLLGSRQKFYPLRRLLRNSCTADNRVVFHSNTT